jgi:hypothetical protein
LCLDPRAYVEVVVYERLVGKGVRRSRALAVAQKVGRAYATKMDKQRDVRRTYRRDAAWGDVRRVELESGHGSDS